DAAVKGGSRDAREVHSSRQQRERRLRHRRADVMRPGSGGCFSSRVRLFVAMALASALIARARILLTSDFGLQTSATPRVVVLIVVDQMRADYFERYANQFTDGFKRLWDRG